MYGYQKVYSYCCSDLYIYRLLFIFVKWNGWQHVSDQSYFYIIANDDRDHICDHLLMLTRSKIETCLRNNCSIVYYYFLHPFAINPSLWNERPIPTHINIALDCSPSLRYTSSCACCWSFSFQSRYTSSGISIIHWAPTSCIRHNEQLFDAFRLVCCLHHTTNCSSFAEPSIQANQIWQ